MYDWNGTVIVYMNKTMPVYFMFDTSQGRIGNNSINRYALQWGPIIGPNQLYVENKTVVPMVGLKALIHSSRQERIIGKKISP